MDHILARLHEANGYCTSRSPEAGVMCQRMAGHTPAWHANAGSPGDERVWYDEEADVVPARAGG